MTINKKAPEGNQEQNTNYNNSLSQWKQLCKQAYDEICDICENGSLQDLINIRVEAVSEATNNKWLIYKIDKAIEKTLRGEV